MRRLAAGLLSKSAFFRKLFMLAGGTMAGQALIVISSPLLTRFFTPEGFGMFAVFGALTGIFGVAVAWRLEFAIPVIQDDEAAAAMVMVVCLVTVGMAASSILLVWLGGPWLARIVDAPALAPLLWLLPPALLLWGIGSALSYWSLRNARFAVNGVNHTLQLGSQAGGQVLLGWLGTGSGGLVLGYVLGYVVRLLHYLSQLPAAERQLMCTQSLQQLWRSAKESWRYPAFAFPSSLLQSLCNLAPAILVAALYGPAMAGLYALSQRIVGLPVRLLSEAASQVFLGELRNLEGKALHRFFLRTFALFCVLGTVGMLPLLLFGPDLFALVFGESWREAGVLVQLLIPLFLVRFVVLPVSQLLYALKRQDIHLLSAILNGMALVSSFGAGYLLELDAYVTILIFSLSSSASFVFYLVITWCLSGRNDAAADSVSNE
jgi:O-antigen/teichoic acid export membrane protein